MENNVLQANIKQKQKIFLIDFVIAEDICNMSCEYCLTGSSTFKKTHNDMSNKNKLAYENNTKLKAKIDKITDILDANFDIGVLKVSGGEIFLIKNIIDYFEKYSKKPKIFQILTNGLSLDEAEIKELKKLDNVCIQLSLDHNTVTGNSYRSTKEAVVKKVLQSIDLIVKNNIPLEINCVLTDRNTAIIKDFAEYLMRYEDKEVMLLPFPVRGIKRELFYPKKEQLQGVSELLNKYNRYKGVLPPKPYMEHLHMFLDKGTRTVPCLVPKYSVGVFDDGIVTPCANYWFTSLGNVLEEDYDKTLNKIENDKIYRLLLNKNNGITECDKCFTPWEILNLYCADYISDEELMSIPSYNFENVKDYINK